MTKMIERTKATPRLARRRPGYWRNRWTDEYGSNAVDLGDGTGYGYGKYPSSELAEQKAMEHIAVHKIPARVYLGTVHFPDETS